jgi:hypothetical protein
MGGLPGCSPELQVPAMLRMLSKPAFRAPVMLLL